MSSNFGNNLILTVSVAAYNAERFIDECLDSFADEKFIGKVEVLVIDDGGTDSTFEHVSKYENKYPGIYKKLHKENGGWGSVINLAIDEAKGKYYKHVDADDYFDKQSLLQLIKDLENIDVDIFFTPYMQFDDETKAITYTNNGNKKKLLNRVISVKEFDDNANHINMHSCCYRTQMLKDNDIKLLEHHFYTDAELFIKCLGVAQNAYMVDYIVYCYRFGRSEQSCSNEGIKKHYKELKGVINSLVKYSERTNINNDIVKKHIEEQMLGYMSMCGIAKDYDELKQVYKEIIKYSDTSTLNRWVLLRLRLVRLLWRLL